MPRAMFAAIGVGACLLAAEAAATEPAACPPAVTAAQQLILVTAAGLNAKTARLARYRRGADGAWQADGDPEPAVLGARGLGWAPAFQAEALPGEPLKREGDKRSPAGIFRIGRSFGFAPRAAPGHLVLRPGETICVDDPRSPAYGSIVPRRTLGAKVSGEDMGAIPLYRRGLVVDYPAEAASRSGSCIFVHVWRSAATGTAGCVALSEAGVARLQDFADGPTAIAILPERASLASPAACRNLETARRLLIEPDGSLRLVGHGARIPRFSHAR